jgi:YggT family protein
LLLTIIQILQVLIDVVWWIIIIQFILSVLIAFNVINTYNDFVRSVYNGLERATDPIYRPIRRMLPNTGAIDFSPLVVIVLLVILQVILRNVASYILYGTPL